MRRSSLTNCSSNGLARTWALHITRSSGMDSGCSRGGEQLCTVCQTTQRPNVAPTLALREHWKVRRCLAQLIACARLHARDAYPPANPDTTGGEARAGASGPYAGDRGAVWCSARCATRAHRTRRPPARERPGSGAPLPAVLGGGARRPPGEPRGTSRHRRSPRLAHTVMTGTAWLVPVSTCFRCISSII